MSTRRRDGSSYGSIWFSVFSAQAGTGVRFMVSLIAGLQLAAAGVGVPWLLALLSQRGLRDEQVLLGLLAAGVVWFGVLAWIWRRSGPHQPLLRPILLTAALILIAFFGSIMIDEAIRNEEPAIAAWLLFLSSVLAIVWLPTIARGRLSRAVFNADETVDVSCPACGYSLIGLHELRCPECGTAFTIDELIAAQGYGQSPAQGPRVVRTHEPAPRGDRIAGDG
ncbi:MAG: hypothetical protein CHACPFDD_00908 [Phycisphaerae bacterium]|nr:hypothetical protein [Phycisphaerae bacterium]